MQEDPFQNHINKNILETVSSMTIESGKAKQSGNPYTYLLLTFENGYSLRVYPTNEAKFIISQLF